VICHRGYWKNPEEQNTLAAFERSLDAGLGIETDVRFEAGRPVLSHEPVTRWAELLEWFFLLYTDRQTDLPVALNVKEAGLQGLLARC